MNKRIKQTVSQIKRNNGPLGKTGSKLTENNQYVEIIYNDKNTINIAGSFTFPHQ